MLRLVLTVLFLTAWFDPVHAQKRVALVIGNSSYKHVSSLSNPKNDADDMAKALERLDFKVRRENDLGRHAMQDVLAEFSDTASGADMAVIFYAGHGIGIDKQNYLIPVDAKLNTDRKVRFETVSLDTVLSSLDGVKGVRMVLLDACRNNPFMAKMKVTSASRSVARGLSRVEPSGATLISFAAKDGTTAKDGTGRNSPYTAALLEHLDQPGLELQFMFRKVRDAVLKATAGEQEPFTYGSLPGTQIFLKEPVAEAKASQQSAPRLDKEVVFWNSVKDAREARPLEEFLKEFPDGTFAGLARFKLAKLNAGNSESDATATPETKVAVGVFPNTVEPTTKPAYRPGEVFKDCDKCPEMVVIPAGSFLMGSPKAEKKREKSEGPQRKVTIPQPFAVGRFEITVDQFSVFAKETGHRTGNKCWIYSQGKWQIRSGRSYKKPGFRQTGTHPAVCIGWSDANAYLKWIGEKTGKPYRLLSEAEWEYAARAGASTAFATGKRISTKQANFDGRYVYNGSKKGGWKKKTTVVGSFDANRFGLHDMHGNVMEWTADCWSPNYRGAPTDGSARVTGDCSKHVLRGSSWNDEPWFLRSAYRYKDVDSRSYDHGFRIARPLDR